MQIYLRESVIGLRWVILSHVAAALLILTVCSFTGEKNLFSRGKVLLFGSILSMNKAARTAWCLSLSRLLIVLVYACMPGEADLIPGIIIGLETLAVLILTGDMKTGSVQLLSFAAIYMILLLQGLFYRYNAEVESQRVYQLIYIFLGVFAGLAAVQQTLSGHEQLIRGSNPEMAADMKSGSRKNRKK